MAKRFTDTEKWKDPWFCSLTERQRGFWMYLVDNCNHAGIWQVNWPLVSFYFPESDGLKHCVEVFNGRVVVLSEEKWFIGKFVDFQYGTLNPENRTHKSVIDILNKEGAYKGLARSSQGRKDKGTDKDKGLDKGGIIKGGYDFEAIWSKYPNKDGHKAAQRHFRASVKTDQDWADINKSLANYLTSERVQKNFIKNGSTWFSNWRDWLEFKEDICPKCKGKGVFTSTTGFEIVCKCPAGNRVSK